MNTLVEEPFPKCLEKLLFEKEIRENFLLYKNREAAHEFERGELSEAEFFTKFYKEDTKKEILNKLPSPQKIKNELFKKVSYVNGMQELLLDLQKSQKCLTGIASNYSEWNEIFLKRLPDLKACNYLFFSCELGLRKPDPKYYEKINNSILEKNKENKKIETCEIMFIDDRIENLDGVKIMGWKKVLHKNANYTRNLIEEFIYG